eukprot:6196619-Pleurochrysis_carterae.AAC.2
MHNLSDLSLPGSLPIPMERCRNRPGRHIYAVGNSSCRRRLQFPQQVLLLISKSFFICWTTFFHARRCRKRSS